MTEHNNIPAEPLIGLVIDCEVLNVRLAPSMESEVLCKVHKNDELLVDLTKSTDDWFSVCTTMGVDGFCKKEFIEIKSKGDSL